MLARTPRKEDFATLLRIPPKPPAIEQADVAWRKAVADREAGQARHVEATRQLSSQVPGQPPVITFREVEELGLALRPLFDAEKKAAETRTTLRAEYDAKTSAALADAFEKLRQELGDKVNEIEELLTLGANVHAAAVAAGIKLPDSLPTHCKQMLTSVVASARYSLRPRVF